MLRLVPTVPLDAEACTWFVLRPLKIDYGFPSIAVSLLTCASPFYSFPLEVERAYWVFCWIGAVLPPVCYYYCFKLFIRACIDE